MTSAPESPSLLGIPREIRDEINELATVDNVFYTNYSTGVNKVLTNPSLLLVNKQIRREVLESNERLSKSITTHHVEIDIDLFKLEHSEVSCGPSWFEFSSGAVELHIQLNIVVPFYQAYHAPLACETMMSTITQGLFAGLKKLPKLEICGITFELSPVEIDWRELNLVHAPGLTEMPESLLPAYIYNQFNEYADSDEGLNCEVVTFGGTKMGWSSTMDDMLGPDLLNLTEARFEAFVQQYNRVGTLAGKRKLRKLGEYRKEFPKLGGS